MSTSENTSPTAPYPLQLSDPAYAIEHLARIFRVEVDTAREFTYRTDFPQPIKMGRRFLWFAEEVQLWARKQPRFSVEQRKRNSPTADVPPAAASEIKNYKPRAKKDRKQAA